MKKSIKILIIFLVLVIVGLISYIAIDKFIQSKDKEEKKENNVVETEKVEESEKPESSDKDIEARVLADITDEKHLKSMNINKDDISIFQYCSIDTEYGPMYFVLISYQPEGEAEHGVIYYTRNTEGNASGVSYSLIEDTKYLSDSIAYDSNKKIVRLSASYHDRTRTNYFELKKGGLLEEVDLAIKDGDKSYNFVELKLKDIELNKKKSTEQNDEKKSTSLNGEYTRPDDTKRTEGTLTIKNYTGDSFEFDIGASHVNSADVQWGIENGAVSVGGTSGVAKRVSDGVYEFVPDEDDELMEDWEGEYKIVFTVKSDNSIELKEKYDKDNHSEGPYGGHNVWFDGTYTK